MFRTWRSCTARSAAGTARRVTFLADHIDSGITALHIHQSEDELLCPKLIERVPEQARWPSTGQ